MNKIDLFSLGLLLFFLFFDRLEMLSCVNNDHRDAAEDAVVGSV